MSSLRLKDLIHNQVVSVSPNTPIIKTLQKMRDRKISCIIIEEDNLPVGIFTERDIVQFFIQFSPRMIHKEIHTVMTSPVFTQKMSTGINDAYQMMESMKIRHIVVVDDENRMVGVLTHTDIINHLYGKYCSELLTASDIMSHTPLSFSAKATVSQILTKMIAQKASCIIVTDKYSRPVGIFTERDAAHLALQEISKLQHPVEAVMKSPVIPVFENTLVKDAVTLMKKHSFRRVVVIDELGMLKGIITQSDIVKEIDKYFRNMMRMMRMLKSN